MSERTKKSAHQTREQWLNAFAAKAAAQFKLIGFPLPKKVRISIGFTSVGLKGKAIGQCWEAKATEDEHFEIFIKPTLQSDARIADVLTHELVHAAVGLEDGHGKLFKQCATKLGLEGKMTATVAGDKWREWALPILKELGRMPGKPLRAGISNAPKKQTTRLIKCECDTCGFIFRASQKAIDGALDGLQCPDATCGGTVEAASAK